MHAKNTAGFSPCWRTWKRERNRVSPCRMGIRLSHNSGEPLKLHREVIGVNLRPLLADTDGPSALSSKTSFALVTPRRRYRGDIHSQSCHACAGRRSGTNTHLLLAINLKESHARCHNKTPVRLGIHEGFWRSPKEHPVAPLAGAVNPRWARGDSLDSGCGLRHEI